MKKTTMLLFTAGLALLLSVGCASRQALHTATVEGPLELTYDILYADSTALSVDLMVLTERTPSADRAVMRGLDRAVEKVAGSMSKSEILARQDRFRSELTVSFRRQAPELQQAYLVVRDVNAADRWPGEEPSRWSMK